MKGKKLMKLMEGFDFENRHIRFGLIKGGYMKEVQVDSVIIDLEEEEKMLICLREGKK